MKNTYIAPTVSVTGSIVRETMSGAPNIVEQTPLKRPGAGSVGFYL